MVFLSVIICTRNRAHEIVNCLPPLLDQAKESEEVEILVIDNGSTDNTAKVVEEAAGKYQYPIRYFFESIPGLCQARNRGRREAGGEVLAYIDDDAIVMKGWLNSIVRHFREEKSDCLGGRVTIDMQGTMPFRLESGMHWFFMASTLGETPRFLSHPQHPTGCNMAFKTFVFDRVGGFNTELKLYGDETDFFARVYQRDFSVYYDPTIVVSQVIPAERLTKSALREKSFQWGQGAATNWLLRNQGSVSKMRKRIEYLLRTVYMAVMSAFRKNFGAFYTYWYNRGYLSQLQKGLSRDHSTQKINNH